MNRRSSTLLLVLVFLCTAQVRGDIVTDGLIMDLNADVGTDASTIGDEVSEWENQVEGSGDDVETNSAAFPTLVEGPNSHHAVRLADGARMVGSDPDAFDDIMLGTGHTWFAVVKAPEQDHGAKNAIFGTLTNANPWTGVVAHVAHDGGGVSVGNYMTRPTGSDVFARGVTDINDDEFHILAGRLEEGLDEVAAELFLESATPEAESFPIIIEESDSDEIAIGAERSGGGEHFDGDIARILIYDRPLSESEMNTTGGELAILYGLNWEGVGGVPGDYNGDTVVDAKDIDLQAEAMKDPNPDLKVFDENDDLAVDGADRVIWVKEHAKTWVGDANLDGEFNSGDLVTVFAAGKYELDEMAGWEEGDWDGDMRFSSGDLVVAFADGGYEKGAQPEVRAVPEPSAIVMLLIGSVLIIYRTLRRT